MQNGDQHLMALARTALEVASDARDAWVRSLDVDEVVRRKLVELLDEYDAVAAEAPLVVQGTLPTRLGRFKIVERIGSGASSVVYSAFDTEAQRLVALKVLYLDASDELLHRFEQEARILGDIRHPGIASCLELGATDHLGQQVHWIAFEHIHGLHLDDAVERAGRDPRHAIGLIRQVAEALAHVHARGVFHRDLKPSNVLVDEGGHAKLLDFGVAALVDRGRLTATGQIVGTLPYLSPEQVDGRPVDGRADQFSLAVMAYEALTGALPYASNTGPRPEWLGVVSWHGILPPNGLDRDLVRCLRCALDPERRFRYPSMVEFGEDLDRWLEGRPVLVRGVHPRTRLRRFVARHRALVSVSLSVIAILTVALVMATRNSVSLAREKAHVEASRDVLRAQALVDVEERGELWPRRSWVLGRMDEWLVRAERILALRSTSTDGISDAVEEFEMRAALAQLAGANGIRAVIARRRDVTHETIRTTIVDAAEDWDAACSRVASDRRFPDYELRPIEGLLPLGPDARSGLEEFLIADSGSRPARNAAGFFELTEDSGVVLVLVPGGVARIGIAPDLTGTKHLNGDRYDLTHDPRGYRFVPIEPFLIAKYEVTQGQWAQVMRTNPSEWRAGEVEGPFGDRTHGYTYTLLHPVESVDQEESLVFAGRLDCTLPTEAQWQHAACADESGLRWTRPGAEFDPWHENTAMRGRDVEPGLRGDEFPLHAPVGTFSPNPFGLFDMGGNVQERCLDPFKVDLTRDSLICVRAGDGLTLDDGGGDTANRGPHFGHRPHEAILSNRWGTPAWRREVHLGLRLARSATP
ncbi:MAG: bifunctional serine/threonine-protein kinase/formylglycine-generating enzyme family protein [Planctomycetota bacterium]